MKRRREGEYCRPERSGRSRDRNSRVVGKPVAGPEISRKLQMNPRIVQGKAPERRPPFDNGEVPRRGNRRRRDDGGIDGARDERGRGTRRRTKRSVDGRHLRLLDEGGPV